MPQKILIVEDQLESRNLLAEMLEMNGYHTLCAKDGREGFTLALSEKPDLIITDLSMPNLDGITMIKMLRGEPGFSSLPIIMLTAHHGEMLTRALNAGANIALTKPVCLNTLLKKSAELLTAALSA